MRSWLRMSQTLLAWFFFSVSCWRSLASKSILLTLVFSFASPLRASEPVRLGAFNIQVLGPTKVSNPKVLKTIIQILARYDMTFVQEIRDGDSNAIKAVLDGLNSGSRRYEIALSERLGRSVSKEQYAFIYDPSKITLINAQTFVDSADDFEREPYLGRFQAKGLDFSMIGIHVTPRAVAQELQALNKVYRDVRNRWQDSDVVLLGDLNADCSYYNASAGFDFFDEPVYEVLPPETDTTVAAARCTYDRILAFGDIVRNLSQGKAYNFARELGFTLEEARAVSDHYPVEFLLDSSEGGTVLQTRPEEIVEQKTADEQPPSTALETEPEASAGPVCGEAPYRTPRGYCYASFSWGKRRVRGTCCEQLPLLIEENQRPRD